MVRTVVMVMVMLAGCVADEESRPTIRVSGPDRHVIAPADVVPTDICAEATGLATDDICSLMCDPDAMKARLVEEGTQTGVCYEFSCPLPDGTLISVGVCLPAPN
jgi:hypothetical protein